MDRLSWLKRPFDPNLQYSFLNTFCGMLSVMFFERILQLPGPDIHIPQGWNTALRLLLGAAFAGVMVLLAYRGRNRKRSFVRGWGWYDLGTILGCLTAARMEPQAGEDSRHLLFLAGLLTLLLAGGLRVEWRERSLTEE